MTLRHPPYPSVPLYLQQTHSVPLLFLCHSDRLVPVKPVLHSMVRSDLQFRFYRIAVNYYSSVVNSNGTSLVSYAPGRGQYFSIQLFFFSESTEQIVMAGSQQQIVGAIWN